MDPKWVLLVLCCWLYSVSATLEISIPVSVQEVTTPSVSFSSSVTTMIPHPSNPRILVVTNLHAVWTLDLQTFNKTLIAGSSSGYIEGYGSAARFKYLRGSAEFDQTTVLFADCYNHCLRTVSLISGSTQRYAGVCRSTGSNDGYRTSSKFYYPWGMAKKGSTFYINDYYYRKIRKLVGNIVSTLVTLSTHRPFGLTWNGEKFLYSFPHGVGDSENSVITGSLPSSAGFSDGSLNSAQFYWPYDVLAVTTQVFLVADWKNRAVRLGDLSKRTVSTLNTTNSRWTYPWSLIILNGSVYVGTDYGRIFKFPLNEIPVVLQDLDCSADLTLPSGQCGESVIFEPSIADIESVECVDCPQTQNLSVGVYNFTYTYRGSLGYDLNICNQVVTVKDVSYFECPRDQDLSLPADAGYVIATFQKSQTSCDWSNLRCVECPSSAQLNEGEHEIKFTYMNLITERNLTCNYNIRVTKHTAPPCDNITEHIYLSADQEVSNKISAGDISIAFPPGVYSMELYGFCHHKYIVHEWSNTRRQSEFQAQYPLNCSTLSTSYWIINATLLTHKIYLTTSCPECKVTSDSPDVKCINDTFIVTWKTNITGSKMDKTSDMESNLQAALTAFQSRNPRLYITVFTAGVPSVVSPVTNESGSDLKAVVKTSCLDEGFIYHQPTDGCVRAPCARW